MAEPRPPAIVALGEPEALLVSLFLCPGDACRVQAVARGGSLIAAAKSEAFWTEHARRAFGLGAGAPTAPRAAAKDPASWRDAYAKWAQVARDVGLGHAGGAPAEWIDAWHGARRWLKEHAPEIDRSLNPPVERASVDAVRECMGDFEKPPAWLGLWSVCDGQKAPMYRNSLGLQQRQLRDHDNWANGLFGGYAVYDHEVSVIFLPLADALRLTREIHNLVPSRRELLAFACSFNYHKIYFVDVSNSSVHAWRRTSAGFEPMAPAGTGLLGWFSEFVRRLEGGVYLQTLLRPESDLSSGICVVPAAGPDFTCCVTRGVEVTAGCVYMPEHPQGWTYRIAFRLVGSAAERGFDTCQLSARHWEIQGEGRELDHVRGEGVIGLYPILADGGWILNQESDPNRQYKSRQSEFQPGAFCYQSCSGRTVSMRGTFGGEVTFVPGTRRRPTGNPFEARVQPFRLCVPEFLY